MLKSFKELLLGNCSPIDHLGKTFSLSLTLEQSKFLKQGIQCLLDDGKEDSWSSFEINSDPVKFTVNQCGENTFDHNNKLYYVIDLKN